MPESDDRVLASSTIEIPIERVADHRVMSSLEEVWHHGRATEDLIKAQVLYALAERGMVLIEDLRIEWEVRAVVKAVQVPAAALEGVEKPEDLEKRMSELQDQFRAAHERSPSWSSTLIYKE